MMVVRAAKDLNTGTEITFPYAALDGIDTSKVEQRFKDCDFVCSYEDACRKHLVDLLRLLLEAAVMRERDIQLKFSVGTTDGFPQCFLDSMAKALSGGVYETIDWVETSEEEDDLLYGELREVKYRAHNVIKERR
jgi:hypothetical protein